MCRMNECHPISIDVDSIRPFEEETIHVVEFDFFACCGYVNLYHRK